MFRVIIFSFSLILFIKESTAQFQKDHLILYPFLDSIRSKGISQIIYRYFIRNKSISLEQCETFSISRSGHLQRIEVLHSVLDPIKMSELRSNSIFKIKIQPNVGVKIKCFNQGFGSARLKEGMCVPVPGKWKSLIELNFAKAIGDTLILEKESGIFGTTFSKSDTIYKSTMKYFGRLRPVDFFPTPYQFQSGETLKSRLDYIWKEQPLANERFKRLSSISIEYVYW